LTGTLTLNFELSVQLNNKALWEITMQTRTVSQVFVYFAATILSAYLGQAQAADLKQSNRAETFEITFSPQYIYSKSLDGTNGTNLDINDTWGWGIGLGYNFSEKLNLAWTFEWAAPNFNTTIVDESTGNTINRSGTLSTSSSFITGTYNFMDKTVTPFVSASLGWVYADSHIPNSDTSTGCWWTWYGYYCGTYQSTYATSSFSYGVGLGGRWDLNESVFIKAAYNVSWIDDLGNAGTQDFDAILLTIGIMQ